MDPLSRRRAARRLLRSSLGGHGTDLALLALWSAIEAVPALLSGRLVAWAIDRGFLRHDTATGLAFLGLFGISVLVGTWGTWHAYGRLAAVIEPFRDALVRLAVRGALRRSAIAGAAPDGAAVARLTQQVEIVREAYASVLMVAQGFVLTTVSALLGLLTLVPAALVLVVPPLVIGVGVFLAAVGRMTVLRRASIMADERIAQSASVVAGGLRDVVACGGERIVEATVGEHIANQARATRQLARLTAVRTLAVAVGGWLPIVLILLGGSWLRRHGASTGAIVGALTYVLQGVHPALQTFVRGVGSTGLWLLVTLRRIVEATEAPSVSGGHLSPAPRSPTTCDCSVRLASVTFAYGAGAQPVIDRLDLHVPRSDHLAIIGPSGVGKSTLANLISGILEPQGGEVTLDGECVRDLAPAALARRRVLIPQEAYLFAGTLRDNLLYLREDAPSSELDCAVERLGARTLIDRLGGYDEPLDASELSAGERQLLTLVRAWLSPAPLVVLDEATCHLDPIGEARAEEAFARRPGTMIVIAHRITSALRARHILLLDGTNAVLGTHEELLSESALYRDLVGHWQLGGRLPVRVRDARPAGRFASALVALSAAPDKLAALIHARQGT